MARIIQSPGQPNRRSIKVETRQGTAIDNQQDWDELTPFYLKQVKDWENKHKPPEAIHGSFASPVYNCHGLTFASRRTCIFDIACIIKDDDYCEVEPSKVRLGDIVVYYSGGDAEHSGIVIEISKDGYKKILSKWGRGKEVIHWIHVGPYEYDIIRYYRVNR